MQQSKVIKLLALLTPAELHKLERFTQSPFFSCRTEAVILFNYIMKYAPDYSHEKLKRQIIAETLFANRKRKEHALNHAASELFKLIESFISYMIFENNEAAIKINLLRFYESRTEGILFENAAESIRRLNDKTVFKDEHYYYNSYTINDLYAAAFINAEQSLLEVTEKRTQSLDVFHAICKLQHFCTLLNNRRIHKLVINIEDIDRYLVYLDQAEQILEYIPVKLYYHSVKLQLRRDSQVQYETLKKLLSDNFDILDTHEIRSIYIIAEGYCIEQMNKGNNDFSQEILSLYEERLAKNLLFVNGYLPNQTFKNILSIYIRLQYFEKAEKFISDYQDRLQPEYQQSNIAYANGMIAYFSKKYEKAIDHLLGMNNYPNAFFKFESRVFLIKSYYELRYFDKNRGDEIMESALAALRRLADESESLSRAKRMPIKNFTLILMRILKIVFKRKFTKISAERLAIIERDINKRVTQEKEWLLEKVQQLAQGR